MAVLVMILRKRKFNPTHIFIVALALSDILFSILIHPMLIATSFGVDSQALFGTNGCNWYGFIAVFFGGLSMWIHGSVAYTRFKLIVQSESEFWHKPRHNIILLILNISIAFIFAIGKGIEIEND